MIPQPNSSFHTTVITFCPKVKARSSAGKSPTWGLADESLLGCCEQTISQSKLLSIHPARQGK